MGAFPNFATVQMSFVTCCRCGIIFGMPDHVAASRRHDHENFYCPNGHSQHFVGQSNEEKLQTQVQQLEKDKQNLVKQREWAEKLAREAADDAKVARSHAKHVVTISRKLRARLKTGFCPCCDAKFDNLEAHMIEHHPTYR